MSHRNIYNYTSIARPVDPAYPTNKAVLVALPLVALACALAAWLGFGAMTSPASAAGTSALVAFGSWALTRELAPDDNPAAFISMFFGLTVVLAMGEAGVLLLFVCLFLVRVANRSTGKALTLFDTVTVLSLTFWASYRLGQPGLPLVAAVAFLSDGLLPSANKRSLVAVIACLLFPAALAVVEGAPTVQFYPLPMTDSATLSLVLIATLVVIGTHRQVTSIGDVGGVTLSTGRVRMGLLMGLLVAIQSFFESGTPQAGPDFLIWACLAGVLVGRLIPRRTEAQAPHG